VFSPLYVLSHVIRNILFLFSDVRKGSWQDKYIKKQYEE